MPSPIRPSHRPAGFGHEILTMIPPCPSERRIFVLILTGFGSFSDARVLAPVAPAAPGGAAAVPPRGPGGAGRPGRAGGAVLADEPVGAGGARRPSSAGRAGRAG